MEMVRLTLTDGTTREITKDEMKMMNIFDMREAFEGKAIIDIEFFHQEDN